MLKCISMPSQLRRRITSLARLGQLNTSPVNSTQLAEAQVAIENIRLELIDAGCSALQGISPAEAAEQLRRVLNVLEQPAIAPGFSSAMQYKVSEIKKHAEPMIHICQDANFSEELQAERLPLASYLHQTETVLLANGSLMAESFRLFLESFGIQCILGRESAGVVYGLTVGPLGEVDVKVSPENALDAKILLTAMQKGYFIRPGETDEEMMDETDLSDTEMDEQENLDDL